MLRVTTPGPTNAPLWRGSLSQQQPEPDIRQQIVDLAYKAMPGTSSLLYEIRKKDISPRRVPLSQVQASKDNKDNLRRVHLKILRETNAKSSRGLPSVDGTTNPSDQQLRIVSDTNRAPLQTETEPYKRPRTSLGNDGRSGPKAKTVRFKFEDTNQSHYNTSGSSSPSSGSKCTGSSSYEVRGNAIPQKDSSRIGSGYRRENSASRRPTTFQNSLELFKRRLKVNSPERFVPANSNNIDENNDDYVIRRIRPAEKPASPEPSTPPTEPRLLPRPPPGVKPSPRMQRARILLQRTHAQQQCRYFEEQDQENTVKCTYRLPEDANWRKEVSFQVENIDMLPHVKTYVVENDRKKVDGKGDIPVTLTTHNLGVHNSLTCVRDEKLKLGETEMRCDPRFLKWLEDSGTHPKVHQPSKMRVVRFRLAEDRPETPEAKDNLCRRS